MHIDKLEYSEPAVTCEIHAGTFHWTNPAGEQCDAEFFVTTCAEEDKAKRVNDLNEQFTDEWERLIATGNTNVRYIDVTPNLIF